MASWFSTDVIFKRWKTDWVLDVVNMAPEQFPNGFRDLGYGYSHGSISYKL